MSVKSQNKKLRTRLAKIRFIENDITRATSDIPSEVLNPVKSEDDDDSFITFFSTLSLFFFFFLLLLLMCVGCCVVMTVSRFGRYVEILSFLSFFDLERHTSYREVFDFFVK